MATIKPRRGTSYPASGLVQDELAIDTTNRRVYIGSAGGSGITVASHITDYVSSVNGSTGTITNVARTNEGNTFTTQQILTAGLSASSSSNTAQITCTAVGGIGLVVANDTNTANSGARIGRIQLGRAGTDTYNTVLENSSGQFSILVGSTSANTKAFVFNSTNGITLTGSYIKLVSNIAGFEVPAYSVLRYLVDDGFGTITNADIQPNAAQAASTVQTLPLKTGTLLNTASDYVSGICGATGAITLSAGSNMSISRSGSTITFASTASGGSSTGISAGTGISASFSGNSYTIENIGVLSINGKTGAITGVTAAFATVGATNANVTFYPVFVRSSGDVALYTDPTTSPLSYNPNTSTVSAKVFYASQATNSISIDGGAGNVVLNDGTNTSAFTPFSFDHNGPDEMVFSSTLGLGFYAPYVVFGDGSNWGWQFPTTNGINGQVLTTNGNSPSGTLSWSNSVSTINGSTGNIGISAGSNITITKSGNTYTIASSGGGSGFTYAVSAPGTPSVGDRWISSSTGKEYVYVNDGNSSQWMEPVSSNGLTGITYDSSKNLLQFGLTGSFTKLGINTNTPQYTLDVNGNINASSGISASGATFNGAVVSDGGYRINSSTINAQTTSYTIISSDNGKIITMSAASGITLTVPSGLEIGFNTTVIQLGTGSVGISAGAGVTLNAYGVTAYRLSGQHAAVSIISYLSNTYNIAGGLTG